MFGKKKKVKSARIDTLVGKNTTIDGNITYSGGLHVEGKIVGNIDAGETKEDSVLIVSESGYVKGHVHGPIVILNGRVDGDVKSTGSLELASKAKICGDVYYNLLEMEVGAEVNGNLIHVTNAVQSGGKMKIGTSNPSSTTVNEGGADGKSAVSSAMPAK